MGLRAVDRQRRRHPEPVLRQGQRRALVARRQARALSRRRRAERDADLRPLGRRGWPADAGHARRRDAARPALVARRQVDRLRHVRRREERAARSTCRPSRRGRSGRPRRATSQKLHYRQDQIGFLEDGYMHLFVVPADGGSAEGADRRQMERRRAATSCAAPPTIEWTPDGRSIVFEGLRDPDAERKYQMTQIYAVEVASGAIRDVVGAPRRMGAAGAFRRTDEASPSPVTRRRRRRTRSAISTSCRSAGGAMKKISADLDRDPISPRWAPDGSGVYFDAQDRGSQNVYYASVAGGAPKPVTTGTHMLTFDSMSKRSRRGRHRDRSRAPAGRRQVQPEGAGVDDEAHRRERRSAGRQAAREDRGDLVHVDRATPRSRAGSSSRRRSIRSKKYPLILEIHGGPFSMYAVGVQLHVAELRRQQLRGALHQPARQHRLRRRVLRRHRSQLSRRRTTTT